MPVDGYLRFEDGEVRLGGGIVPGVLVSKAVSAAVRFDQAEHDGLSGKAKVPLGWEDADITLVVDLLSDDTGDCYDKLAEINRTFKGADNGANPKVYTVTNRHARARGIDQVVFSGLDSEEDDQSDVIRATLKFVEHRPPIVRREQQVSVSKQASGAAPTVAATPPSDQAILDDPDSPLAAGFKAGNS